MTASLPSVEFQDSELPNLVELKQVSQMYIDATTGKAKTVLDRVNFLVEDHPDRGQFVVLLGPSGCGKSTILRYIAGLQTPTSGEVRLNDRLRSHKDAVGMVFQRYSSFEWRTALGNVMFGLEIMGIEAGKAEKLARETLERVGLTAQADQWAFYPNMSGGQLQRVAIARSLVVQIAAGVRSATLLLDEPYSGLDTNTRFRAALMLHEIYEQLHPTIIMVTHDIPEAVFLADDVFIMSANPGRIVSHLPIDLGPERHRDLKRSPEFLAYVNELEDRMIQLDAISASKRVNP